MAKRKKLFITGAAGRVGAAVRRYLRGRYDFRLLFHSNIPQVDPEDQVVVSDLANLENMIEACEGIDAVVHLGIAVPGRSWPNTRYNQEILKTNIQGTYNIFEAARIHKIPKVIFASTNHVTGYYEKEGKLSQPDLPVRPDSMYGVSKAFGEALGRFYHDEYGMSVFCLRIANFPNTDEVNHPYEPGQARWLSASDMAELTACCIEAPHPRFGIIYGVSRGGEKKFDISNAKDLVGWEPKDCGIKP